jgi:hypothetical protein
MGLNPIAIAYPLCSAKRVRRIAKTLFPRIEERIVGRSNDRVSKYVATACDKASK